MLLLLFSVFTTIIGTHLPPGVKLCHQSDPNFVSCVGKNSGDAIKLLANGDQDLGLPRLEPFYIEQLELNGSPNQFVGVQQRYRNVYIHGMTESDFIYHQIQLNKTCGWVLDVLSTAIRLEADYELNGKLMMFPLNAHGKCNITQHNLSNRHTVACEKYTKKNKTFIKVTNYTMDMKPEKISYEFENIFPESEEISAQILKTINENSLNVFKEVKSGFEQVFSIIHLNEINRVFSQIPMNELYLD